MIRTFQITLLIIAAGAALAGWQFQRRLSQQRQLAALEQEFESKTRELETRAKDLAALEQRKKDLLKAEQRAGNHTLISLARERAAAMAASQAASGNRSLSAVFADILADPEQRKLDREYIRGEIRAKSAPYFKTLNLTPQQIDRYVELLAENESRKADRMAALLRGKLTVAEALRQRDQEEAEGLKKLREIVGDEGFASYQGIRTRFHADEAARTVKVVEQHMGNNALSHEQSERLRQLVQAELASLNIDDTDMFRPPEEWTQFLAARQQNVLRQAAEFLTPEQLERVTALAAQDLIQKQQQMIFKRKSFGIK